MIIENERKLERRETHWKKKNIPEINSSLSKKHIN
jgi:hypothetical protein